MPIYFFKWDADTHSSTWFLCRFSPRNYSSCNQFFKNGTIYLYFQSFKTGSMIVLKPSSQKKSLSTDLNITLTHARIILVYNATHLLSLILHSGRSVQLTNEPDIVTARVRVPTGAHPAPTQHCHTPRQTVFFRWRQRLVNPTEIWNDRPRSGPDPRVLFVDVIAGRPVLKPWSSSRTADQMVQNVLALGFRFKPKEVSTIQFATFLGFDPPHAFPAEWIAAVSVPAVTDAFVASWTSRSSWKKKDKFDSI